MTTRITVTTGDGGLLERNAQQQAANRQGTLVKGQAEQAAALGDSQLRAERIAQGRDPATGRPLPSAGSTSRLTRINQEPAAFRGGTPSFLYWFPIAPNVVTVFRDDSNFQNNPYTVYDADAPITRNRTPIAPFNFHLGMVNSTHAIVNSYLPTGGRFGEPVVRLQAPPRQIEAGFDRFALISFGAVTAPVGAPAASLPAPSYTSIGVNRPFAEFTSELEGAVYTYESGPGTLPPAQVFLLDNVRITDQTGLWRLDVAFTMQGAVFLGQQGSSQLTLSVSVLNLQTQERTFYASLVQVFVPPGIFDFSQENAPWFRCTLVYTPTRVLFIANGQILRTVDYPSPIPIALNPTTVVKTSQIRCGNRQYSDIKLSIASFTPKALYRENYTLRSLLS